MTRVAAAVLAVAAAFAGGGCSKAKPADEVRVEPMSPAEIQRSQDACKAYVDKVCACADKVPGLQDKCGLARAMPDAVQLQLSLASAPDTKKGDVLSAHAGIRKVVKECIEQTAQLAAHGCQ